ncbi:MAG: iron-containing redox enzyme family protein [Kofleriaceae bacterium]
MSVLNAITPKQSVEVQLAELHRRQAEHPFWTNPLLASFAQGAFTRTDLAYIFSQYQHYSRSFTKFIAAVMANCDSDLFRAQLSENLWEEGGGCEPDRRHAQIFRNFLTRSLGIEDPEKVDYAPFTRNFVREYLVTCMRAEPMAGAAFLSLGTEGIVARLYEIMLKGLRAAGLPDEELEFFHIHIGCDDEHAVTLENMMASYADQPGWFDACWRACDQALTLRNEFFTSIFNALEVMRIKPVLERMQSHTSLAKGVPDSSLVHRGSGEQGEQLYANQNERLNIDFTVERMGVAAEVLDPRMVRIPPGKFNEKHKHAHETLIHILEGTGQVVIDERVLPVAPGDSVMVPRWAMHQTQNLGTTPMKFLAVTDFNLSNRAYLGNATDYRQGTDADGHRRRH